MAGAMRPLLKTGVYHSGRRDIYQDFKPRVSIGPVLCVYTVK